MIRNSFAPLRSNAHSLVSSILTNLQQDFPEISRQFQQAGTAQNTTAIADGLVTIVDHLDRADVLAEYLAQLRLRHVTLGIKRNHYTWFGLTLFKTLRETLGEVWTEPLACQWAQAFTVIVQLMTASDSTASNAMPSAAQIPRQTTVVSRPTLVLPAALREVIRTAVKAVVGKELTHEARRCLAEEVREIAQGEKKS